MPAHARAETPGYEDREAIAQRLVELRDGMSQAEFARRLGVNVKTVARWESGATAPDAASLVALHEVFGADPTWVLRGPVEGEPVQPPPPVVGLFRHRQEGLHGHRVHDIRAPPAAEQEPAGGRVAAHEPPAPPYGPDAVAAAAARESRRAHLYRRLAQLAQACDDEALGLLLGVAEKLGPAPDARPVRNRASDLDGPGP